MNSPITPAKATAMDTRCGISPKCRPVTCSVTWAIRATNLIRCAGDTAHWQTGIAASLCALCVRIFQRHEVHILFETHSAGSHTLSPDVTLSCLANELAESAQIPITDHVEIQIRPLGGRVPDEKLELVAEANGDQIDLSLSAISAVDVHVLARSLESLIKGASRDPGLDIKSLPILHEIDRERVLRSWNATEWHPDAIRPLHRCFEAQADRTPQATALIDGKQSWTYTELNRAANRLGARLRAEGVSVGKTVGLYVPRSAEMVVGMLGVLKSGAAFIPLDVNQPHARLRKICQQAQPHVTLFSRTHDKHIQALGQAERLFCIETLIASAGEDSDLSDGASPDDPAYMIFTSGSTGEPKGVIGVHRGMCNRVQWVLEHIPLTADAICCQKAALSFIDCIGEILSPLFCGRPLVIVPEREAHDPTLLVAFLAQHRITHLTTVPTLLRMVLTSVGDLRAKLPALRHWICSGEELPADLLDRFFECCDAELYNFYGPSEASIEVSTWHCHREHRPSPVPIGTPIGNTQLYILDAAMQPVLPGVVGELYIGGIGLARGYLGDPQRTAISFVQDPFSHEPEARLYRSGDLARHRSDGVIEFIGRIGRDIKVRGNRVALGEVESAVVSLEKINEAAVIARIDRRGATQLYAYIVCATGSALALETLREQLADKVPEYMIPAYFVRLDQLPRTPSGKLDRTCLPPADPERILRAHSTIPLVSEAEHAIAQCFCEALDIPVSNADDDFLRLGGDSLQATFLLSRLDAQYGLELSLRDFFDQPTVRALAQHLETQRQGAENRSDLISCVDSRASMIPAPGSGWMAGSGSDSFPLSHAQERLWFLARLDGGRGYTVSSALRFEGPLRIEALENVLGSLWERHAALRAIFPECDGLPVSRILEPARPPLTRVRLTPAHNQSSTVQAQIEAHIQRSLRDTPFNLAEGPLLRATLFNLEPTIHTLVLSIHHIVCDGVSIEILIRELASLYNARINGSEPRLKALPLSYVEYAAWERHREKSARMDVLTAFWGERMADAPQVLELPLDHPRPTTWSEEGATHRFRFDPELVESLHKLAQQAGASLFMITHAAFAALLSRLSDQTDLCIGTPAANRRHAEVTDLVGLFVNTLVLRTQVCGDKRFSKLLAQVRENCLDAFDHQDYPFERLVQQLKPERNLSHTPLVQITFALERPLPTQRAGGSEIHSSNLDSGIALFDLSLTLEPTDHDIEGTVIYNKALFEPGTIARWMHHYQRLLEAVVQNPATPVSQLPLLSEVELRALRDFGTGEALEAVNSWCSVLRHFEARVKLSPQATAVVTPEARLSYGRLNTLATQLAGRLRRNGVVAGQLVAICGRRSADLVTAVVAVMKAGAAWLPLDPGYPAARLRFMIEDSGATLLLAHREYVNRLIDDTGLAWLTLDQGDSGVAPVLAENRSSAPVPDAGGDGRHPQPTRTDLAYLIYTSGSTGKPKGVMITHGALESTWRAWDQAYELSGRCHSHLQSASFSFDVFVGDVVRALCSGAKLVMADRETLLTPAALLELLDVEQVDCADLSPVVMRLLAEHLFAVGRDLSALKLLVLGTDAWNTDAHRRWQLLLGPDTHFINAYGVTEATVASTYYDHRHSPLPVTGPVPIGIPLPGETIRIVDRYLNPVPIGIVGEICIGGPGVALGYRSRPTLNAERFFADAQGERHYRSGDLGRWRADGTIEFLGRADAQIKIRGFRVEPGEVEAILASHPAVRQVAVIALPDPLGGNKLRAAVVCHVSEALSATEVRSFAAHYLPEHMLPASVLMLDKLPTSPNGKIDRRAIAKLKDRHSGSRQACVEPRTPEEAVISEILSRLLGLEQIGVDDNFFELGGHSLLATQAATQIGNTLGVTLKVRSFFETPTIAGLARQTRDLRKQRSAESFNIMEPPARRAMPETIAEIIEAPCSAAQKRLLFLHHLDDDGHLGNNKRSSLAYDIPALFRIKGPLDIKALKRSLEQIVERHEILRTTFALPNDNSPDAMQRIHPHLSMPIDVIERNGEAAGWLESLEDDIASIISHPFDLETGPLIRAVLFQRDTEDHALLLHMHHMVSDAWSVGVYVRELRALYGALRYGKVPTLPPLQWQYRDFVNWQRGLPDSDLMAAQLGYWRHQLADIPKLLELPADRARPAIRSHRGGILYHTLSADLVEDLGRLGSRLHASLYMLLLAALGVLLYRRSDQEDLCIGSPIANRGDGVFEDLIGFFVNTLVMRLRLDGEPSFSELVSRVREMALDAYDHAQLPFDRLVEALQPQRSLSHSPLFQVVLALQNVPGEDFTLDGLSVQSLDLHNGTAKFDLLIIAEPSGKELRLEVEYSEDLFDQSTIERMIHSYDTILQAAVAEPGTSIRRLPVLSRSERTLIEKTWNHTELDLGKPRCLHHVFEAQAAKSPDSIAVIDNKGSRMSWRALDQAANTLAHELQGLEIRPGVSVGIFCDRSIEQIIAILGTLKAGAAYVPLDPGYPQERLRGMADDARLSIVLIHSSSPCPDLGVPQRSLAGIAMRQVSQAAPVTGVTPDDLIYVTFTSGSTGRPKGIAMHHAAVWNLIAWHQHETSLSAATTIQYAPLGFDVSFQEIFATFADGGTLILPDEDDRRDPFRLWALIEKTETQRLFLPTAALKPLAAAAASLPLLPSGLRELWIGGEQMRIDADIRALFERLPNCRLVNYYGPSECHAVTWATQSPDPRLWQETPHVGRPIANTRIHILDDLGQYVPIGVAGELCITGSCVAKGYLERPELTAACFVPDPFTKEGVTSASSMYKTGDMACYDARGNIHILGRRDGQTKIRGFRIETGEIETTLLRHAKIERVTVDVNRPGDERAQLFAWIVTCPGVSLDASEVLEFASQSLPDYMLPSHVIFLRQFPLSGNGKVDRSRLRALTRESVTAHKEPGTRQTPRDPQEHKVAQIFTELLGLDRVGREESFFDLGGTSILAMSLVARLRLATGLPLSVSVLIRHSTPAAIAEYLSTRNTTAPLHAPSLVPLQAGQRSRPPFFCVHPVGGNVLCYEALSRKLTSPLYGLQSAGLNANERPLHSVEEMASTYLKAIRTLLSSQPLHLAGWSMGGIVAYEMARQVVAAGGKVASLILLDTDAPGSFGDINMPTNLRLANTLAEDLKGVFGITLDLDESILHTMEVADQLDHILIAARDAGKIPDDLGNDGMRRLLEVFALNLKAMFDYDARNYEGSLTIISARDRKGCGAARDRGWQDLASGDLDVYSVPGDHYTFMQSGNVDLVAGIINKVMMATHA